MHRVAFAVAVAAVALGSTEAFAKYNEKLLTDDGSPVAMSLSARADADGYQGYLSATPERFQSAALVSRPASGGWKLAQAEAAPAPAEGGEAAPAPKSKSELEQELADMQANRPGLGLPIAMTVVGFVLTYVSYLVAIVAASTSGGSVVAIIGVVGLVAGIAILVVGIVLLAKAIMGRVKHSRRMREIENELQNQNSPAPATTPSVRYDGARLAPQFTVATF